MSARCLRSSPCVGQGQAEWRQWVPKELIRKLPVVVRKFAKSKDFLPVASRYNQLDDNHLHYVSIHLVIEFVDIGLGVFLPEKDFCVSPNPATADTSTFLMHCQISRIVMLQYVVLSFVLIKTVC
jgi:hypothetical protein